MPKDNKTRLIRAVEEDVMQGCTGGGSDEAAVRSLAAEHDDIVVAALAETKRQTWPDTMVIAAAALGKRQPWTISWLQ